MISASSSNIAMSIFRFAVKQTVWRVAEGFGLPPTLEALSFLCGLSEILNIEAANAVSVIHAETAIQTRSALLEVPFHVASSSLTVRCLPS